jgi:hypothetical protein
MGLPAVVSHRQRLRVHRLGPRRLLRHGNRTALTRHRLETLAALPPQTRGKVERFHQTVKTWLAKQDPTLFPKQLQRQLEAFADYYNQQRPHRALNRTTPAKAHAARERAYPTRPLIDCAGYNVRHDKIDNSRSVTLRRHGRMHHIGIGRAWAGWRVVTLIADLEIRILDQEGNQLAHRVLDPTKDYQPIP